jgi:hypothetical protein
MAVGRYGTKARFGVFAVGAEWRLCCKDHQLGRYDTQTAAIAAGQRAAFQAAGSGFAPELHFVDICGELRQADPASFCL